MFSRAILENSNPQVDALNSEVFVFGFVFPTHQDLAKMLLAVEERKAKRKHKIRNWRGL